MKYYYRKLTQRYYDHYSQAWLYGPVMQVVLTDHVEDFNKRKRKKFKLMGLNDLDYITHELEPDKVYTFEVER